MKLYKLTSIFLLVLGVSFANASTDDQEPYLTKSFTLNGRGDLLVKTSGGSIEVTGQSSNQVEVNMYVKKNGSWGGWFGSKDDEDLSEYLEDYEIEIDQQGNQIIATAKRKGSGWGNNNLSISFKVKVPRDISTDLSTSGGSISLADLEGSHEVSTSGGSLNFDHVTGTTEARTSGGSINVDDYQGTLDAKTSGGSIRVYDSEGNLAVNTSGGSIVLDDVRGSVEAYTSGGSIRADIRSLEDQLTLKTSGGSINAVIPSGLGLNLDLAGNRVNTELQNFTGRSEKNSIQGSINGGGIDVTMRTSGGSVNLDYRSL
uniref:Adhesin domain-containing protein n=1 Tax=Roseihalotalea indica TaxID=2867963 RepID=A0AA49JDE9_9BACT|nr:hypothetical protein K4G66_25950 [Tunicatimonas sp. TK19036]